MTASLFSDSFDSQIIENARRLALDKARALEAGELRQEPGDLDTIHMDGKTSYKIVMEEKVRASELYERRIAVEEDTSPEGIVTYRVITATCGVGSKDAPDWQPRSSWKPTYREAYDLAHSVYLWNCDYAKRNGFVPPHEILNV